MCHDHGMSMYDMSCLNTGCLAMTVASCPCMTCHGICMKDVPCLCHHTCPRGHGGLLGGQVWGGAQHQKSCGINFNKFLHSMVFAQCIAQVLRKQSGIKTKEDHDSALADSYFETTSRHLSYIFRHTNLMHRDGSLSLHELISHPGTARKIRTLFREGKKSLQHFDENEIIMRLKGRENTFRFLMPLAHVICDSNKARAMIGYVSVEDYQPGVTPSSDSWFKAADFDNETARQAQANILEGVDIASIFIRFESGHSTDVEIQHCPFMPDMFPLRYLIHGTNEKNLDSIRRLGLLPGGTRGGRNHVHFVLDSTLSTLKDVLRTESDCILIGRPGAVAGLSPKDN